MEERKQDKKLCQFECSENEKQHQIGIFINSIDISALYFLTG